MSDAVLIVAILGIVTLGTVAIAFGRRYSAGVSPHGVEIRSSSEPEPNQQKAARATFQRERAT
jgi:hypothetical protein